MFVLLACVQIKLLCTISFARKSLIDNYVRKNEIQLSKDDEIFVVWKLQNGQHDLNKNNHFVIFILYS